MRPTPTDRARAAYVRAVLAWHNVTGTQLAEILQCSQPAASKKLLASRGFTASELLAIADEFGLDTRMLLSPPDLAAQLGQSKWLAARRSESTWSTSAAA